jgi:hypothetical protein
MTIITIANGEKRTTIEIDNDGEVSSVVKEYVDESPRLERVSLFDRTLNEKSNTDGVLKATSTQEVSPSPRA